ncbi:MAG: methyltransferase domain-containing protein [Oligoflexia bacterium]|nr:methyltransferase domain-containing protein [Oligoflexia bacterium]
MPDTNKITACRVCGHDFYNKPLLQYKNMPKAAQFLPDANSLKSEKGIDLDVCMCSGCGLIQLNSEPVSYYKEVVRAAAFSEEMRGFREKQFDTFVKKYQLNSKSSSNSSNPQGKKIIEIGCGAGEYLSIMQKLDTHAYGLEYSEELIKKCKASGLNVVRGFIETANYKIDHAPFAAFYMLNFLEHLPNPNATLTGIRNNLSEEGIGLVEVPNFDMILRKKIFSEFICDHLFYFTKESLSTLLKLNGFEIIECSEVWHDYIISATVKKKERLDISHFYNYQTKIEREINDYIHRFKEKRVAIWGAGHQALAIISLVNLSNKIKYVVDSAPFKQGKFTPATHIPIVSPEVFYKDAVNGINGVNDVDSIEAIIIMAASYSDEVAKIIRGKFDSNVSVSILRDFGLEMV